MRSIRRVAGRPARRRQRGQSMVEFALVAPVFFFMLFGILEFGVLMFDVTSTRFAAGEGARVASEVGDGAKACTDVSGCVALYGGSISSCDADCQAIVAIHRTTLGSTSLERINYIEVQQMTAATSGGPFTVVAGKCQRYNFDGSRYTGPAPTPTCPVAGYPGSTRNVVTGQMDYIQVNINFTYPWLTGMFRSVAKSPTLDSKFIVRLEPQKFS